MDAANLRVHIRGSKNDRRDRWVPIVSDEQRLLLAHAATHAQGVEGKLFRSLGNLRHGLLAAAKKVALEPLPRHALRKAAGQWLIDLSVPLEASFDSDADGDCRIGAAGRVGALDAFQVPSARRSRSNPLETAVNSVPRDRIELPTRGFSIRGGSQKQRRIGPCLSAAAAPVPQKPKVLPVLPRRPAPEPTKKRGPGSKLTAAQARAPLPVATRRKRRGSVLRTADTDG